jgi:hypothetical protein
MDYIIIYYMFCSLHFLIYNFEKPVITAQTSIFGNALVENLTDTERDNSNGQVLSKVRIH